MRADVLIEKAGYIRAGNEQSGNHLLSHIIHVIRPG